MEKDLLIWKENPSMPFMLVGARQTGKTYILKKFCETYFTNSIYINLERESEICEIFSKTLDPEEIIEKIKILKKISFDIKDTIFFF